MVPLVRTRTRSCGDLERRDQLRVEAQNVGAQAAGDAAMACNQRVALDRFQPFAGASKQIGIAFSVSWAPSKAVFFAGGEGRGIEARQIAFERAFPGSVAQLP